jgi:FkbM family methyltransferase
LFPICSILPPLPRLKIVDVGAMSLGEGTEPYAALLKATPCDVIGFEPVTAEFEKLDRLAQENYRFLPYFVGDGATRTFYECNVTMASSLFEPNTELLAKFQSLDSIAQSITTSTVDTKRLDDIPDVRGTDFLKLDVQGAELLVLRGGVNMLQHVLVVQTEVLFVPLYKEQAFFSDVDAFLRGHGFQLHRLPTAAGRTFKPLVANNDLNATMSQILWADAVYVRDFLTFDQMPPTALLKIACILHENYRSFDLAALALESYDRQTGAHARQSYIQRLTGPDA